MVMGPTFLEYAAAIAHAEGSCTSICDRLDAYRPPVSSANCRHLRESTGVDTEIYAIPIVRPGSYRCQRTIAHASRMLEGVGYLNHLDESFVEDFCPQQSIIDMLSDFPRLLVPESFTKFYAIPGLRLGYLVGSR